MVKKNIVVLGGNYAGVNSSHYILKHVLPQMPAGSDHQLVLVNPSSDFFHNSAAPRALVSSELIPEHKYFFSIHDNFKQYGEAKFRFVQGKATAVDQAQRVVHVDTLTGQQQIPYHALILATGASSADAALSSQGGDGSEVRSALKKMREQIKTAKTIVIGGGGPAGVETAGEIGEYINGKPGWFSQSSPKVNIRIITGAEQLLPVLRPARGSQAERILRGLGVEVTYKTRIDRTERNLDGKTSVFLNNGEKIETDIYINATGCTPSTAFLPAEWVNEKQRVKANPTTLRVDVAGKRVYVIGDAGSHTRGGVMEILSAVPVLATNLKTDLLSAEGVKQGFADREFKRDDTETQFVTLGQSTAIGVMKGFKLPGTAVWVVKGRDYMHGMIKQQLDGSHWAKESKFKAVPVKA